MTTTKEAIELFFLAKRAENVQPGTLKLYNWTMERWLERWPGLALGEIGPEHVRGFVLWLQGQGIKSNTVNIHFRNIRTFLRWCQAEDMIGLNVLRNVKPPKVEEVVPDALSEFEAVDLLMGVKNSGAPFAYRDYTIHLFFLVTGVRLAELAALDVEDVNFQGGYALIRIAKGRRQRIVPLGRVLPLELRRYLVKHRQAATGVTALFTNQIGQRMGHDWIEKTVKAALLAYVPRKLQRPGPHALRHTACTFMLRQLKDIKAVAIIMGHTVLETTERYTHLSFDDLAGKARPSLDELLAAKPRRGRPVKLLESSYG